MFDPITIGACLTTASTAFAGLKKAFQAGRDIESMTGDLSRWMGAVSDIEQKEKSAKNPPIFRKVFGSVEQEALEAFAAKKKLEEQRYELKTFIQFSHGHRGLIQEVKRIDILLNKTREEYVTRKEMRDDLGQVMDALHRLEDKLDKVLSKD